jgi:hypothetical protein
VAGGAVVATVPEEGASVVGAAAAVFVVGAAELVVDVAAAFVAVVDVTTAFAATQTNRLPTFVHRSDVVPRLAALFAPTHTPPSFTLATFAGLAAFGFGAAFASLNAGKVTAATAPAMSKVRVTVRFVMARVCWPRRLREPVLLGPRSGFSGASQLRQFAETEVVQTMNCDRLSRTQRAQHVHQPKRYVHVSVWLGGLGATRRGRSGWGVRV